MRAFAVFLFSLAVSGCNCGGSIPVAASFEGFTPHAGSLFVVRWADSRGVELSGTRQSQGVPASGTVPFQFVLPTGTPLKLQYFIDVNDNRQWDGPVGTGEPSWDRDTSLSPPVHNRDSILLTVGYDTHFSELPADFTAP